MTEVDPKEYKTETKKPEKTEIKPKPIKRRKPIDLRPSNRMDAIMQARIQERRLQLENQVRQPVDPEVKTMLKNGVYSVLTFPHPKKEAFKESLQESPYVEKFVDTKLNYSFINALNDNLKFALAYSYYYIQALT